MTELEALEKSVVLWTVLVERLSALQTTEIEGLDEHDLTRLKETIDLGIRNCAWRCYLCEFFTVAYDFDSDPTDVNCNACCISADCGECNIDEDNQFTELTKYGNSRIKKLRAANRMLRSMKKRRSELQKQETQK